MENPKFYISRYVNGAWEEAVDIMSYFDGLYYKQCVGISHKGKIKNIYTEEFAETDKLRVYIPETVARENTELEFTFVFKGENRRDVYDNFIDWISGYKIKYWDTLRNRQTEMILIEAIEPDDDYFLGSEPYMLAKFTFKNLRGQTEKKV